MTAFISSQFRCCPLIWMNHSRALNNKKNRIHESSIRVMDNDKKSTCKVLLDKDKRVSVHKRNLQILVAEMFTVKNGESSSIMYKVFQIDYSNNYKLRKNRGFKPCNPKTVYYGTEPISVLGLKLWIVLPDEYKSLASLKEFKTKIKNWVPQNCKTFIQNVGFINFLYEWHF